MSKHSKSKKAQDDARSKHAERSGTKTKSLRLFVEDIEILKALSKQAKLSQAELIHQALALWSKYK